MQAKTNLKGWFKTKEDNKQEKTTSWNKKQTKQKQKQEPETDMRNRKEGRKKRIRERERERDKERDIEKGLDFPIKNKESKEKHQNEEGLGPSEVALWATSPDP